MIIASSPNATGPFTFESQLAGVFSHEPAAARAPTGEYVVWFTSSAYGCNRTAFGQNETGCVDPRYCSTADRSTCPPPGGQTCAACPPAPDTAGDGHPQPPPAANPSDRRGDHQGGRLTVSGKAADGHVVDGQCCEDGSTPPACHDDKTIEHDRRTLFPTFMTWAVHPAGPWADPVMVGLTWALILTGVERFQSSFPGGGRVGAGLTGDAVAIWWGGLRSTTASR